MSDVDETEGKKSRRKKKKGEAAEVPRHTGTVSADDQALANWVMNLWRGGESPKRIEIVPVSQSGGVEMLGDPVGWDPIAPGSKFDMEDAVDLANRYLGAAQRHVNSLARSAVKGRSYQVNAWNTGVASKIYDRYPIGPLFPKTIAAAVQQQAAAQGILDGGDDETSAKSMMFQVFKTMVDVEDKGLERQGKIAGDMLTLGLEREKYLAGKNGELIDKVMGMADRMADLAMRVADRDVEKKALDIEERDHAEDRADRKAARERGNIVIDIARRGAMEGISILGKVIPGFIDELRGITASKDEKPTQQIAAPQNGATATAPQPQLPTPPEELTLVNRFVEAVRRAKLDEALFGKDDDQGQPVEEGVFTRAQVEVLSNVRTGKSPVEALDALLPDSETAESIGGAQMARAAVLLLTHPEGEKILKDVGRFLTLRAEAQNKKS